MKRLTTAALVAGQIVTAAQPAMGAGLADAGAPQVGAFGGFRLRVPLDGNMRRKEIRAGLALAPTLASQTDRGVTRAGIGEGLEFSFRPDRLISVSVAGMDLRQLRAAQGDEEDDDSGVPIWAVVAGGIVVASGIGLLILADAVNDASE